MKKVLAGITAALYIFAFAGCSNELEGSSNLAGLLMANSSAGAGETGSFILTGEESRAISTSDVKSAVVTITGYDSTGEKFTRKSEVTQISGGKANGIAVSQIPVTKNAVVSVQGYSDVNGTKAITGEIIRNAIDINAGPNSSDVNWETSRNGYIYNALVEGNVNTRTLSSTYTAAINTLVSNLTAAGVHASLIDTAKILAVVKANGTLSTAAADYKLQTATLTYKAYSADGYTVTVQDTLSAASTVSGSSGTITGIAPGKWNVVVKNGSTEISSIPYTFTAGGNIEIPVGNLIGEKTIIFVKAASAPTIWVWEPDGVSISEKQKYTWNTQPAMTAVADGYMKDSTGWFMYEVTGVASGKQMTFILNKNGSGVTNAVCTKTFWYDGSKFYDADPTTPAVPSSDTSVSSIKINGTDVTSSLVCEVANAVAAANVEVTPTDSKATYTVSSTTLAVGVNTITVTVTAEDGITTKDYTITVTRKEPVVDDVTLVSVTVNGSAASGSGTAYSFSKTGSDDSLAIASIVATPTDSNAVVTYSTKPTAVASGTPASVTITVKNGAKTAAYTLAISYTKQEVPTGDYYWTNKNGYGSNKTISSWSDWTEAEKIAQCAAYDDARTWNGYQEVSYDVYALYAAYDDTNLYIMAELTNLADNRASFDCHPYAGSDNGAWWNRDCPIGFILNTGKGATATSPAIEGGAGPIWGAINFSDSQGFDWLLYASSKYGEFNGKFVGVGTPGFFHVKPTGEFSYDADYCLSVNTGTKTGTSGMTIKSMSKCAVSKTIYYESTPTGNRAESGQTGADLLASTTYSSCATSDLDMSYWYTIPLATLGIDKAYIQANGIGVRQITPNGGSLMDCAPWDPSMVDVATEPCTDDGSTSHEKEDVDTITTPQARIGK